MVFIDIDSFSPSQEWLDSVSLLFADLISKENIQDKFILVDENEKIWTGLKTQLPFNDKCWYSEAKEVVSPYEVEHFRPKKVVMRTKSVKSKLNNFKEQQRVDWIKENKYRGLGYWWLAFNYKNYRLSGKFINAIKGTRFPIRDGSFISYRLEDDYNLESPLLLDPTVKEDPELLIFEPDGKVKPIFTDSLDINFIRAFVSIEIYGLNSIELLVKARLNKWADLSNLIDDIEYFYSQVKGVILGEVDLNDNLIICLEKFYYKCDNLKKLVDPSAEYSALAKNCLLSYSYEWIGKYIL